jgi:lipid-binding SYLF domain-containing protein
MGTPTFPPALSRRRFTLLAGATAALAGCDTSRTVETLGLDRIEMPRLPDNGAARIDARVDVARNFLLTNYPGITELETRSAGQLYMPLITEVGFGIGGSYGTGALRVGGATVDYFAAFSASTGFQAGAQQYSHALYFMTPEALRRFRTQRNWSVGGDVAYALPDRGGNLSADTFTLLDPVIALIFEQNGLKAGATLEGTFYQRIRP